MASEQGTPVDLYIYDLTNGLAAVLSSAIIGRQVQGVWHTALVVYDREYFFGGSGIVNCAPGGTQLGAPHRVQRLGRTQVPYQLFVDYLQGLSATTYSGASYRLLEHNCNHFTEEVAQFLCGAHIPKHILEQSGQLPPPLRLALSALLDNVLPHQAADGERRARADSPDYLSLNHEVEQARAEGAALEQRRSTLAEKLARKERRREKKKHKHDAAHPAPANGLAGHVDDKEGMAEAVAEVARAGPSAAAAAAAAGADGAAGVDDELDERGRQELRRRQADPPIVYRDIDGAAEFDKLCSKLADAALSAEEKQSLDELQQYLVQQEGSWVLGDDFLAFIGRILADEALSSARPAALRCLAACALREDVSLLLHQDRRHHALLSYAHRIDTLPPPEQHALALFMCNLFEHLSSSEWLLYISEWESASGQPLSNIRATTKVCVHCALGEGELRELGTALMHNVATKEVKTVVFDEVCVELSMALLQLLAWAPHEEHLWRALKALARLAGHSADVPQLIAMVGPHPSAFKGQSPRVDEQIELLLHKLK